MEVSIIVPMYNEATRAPPFLKELAKLDHKNWEFIFVNDGSRDGTADTIRTFRCTNKRVVSYGKNRGKGYAVRKGVEAACGTYIIFIDADGSIHPSQITTMLSYLKKYEVVVGTRAAKESDVRTSRLRKLLGISFNLYVNLLYGVRIHDNLCGFKGFQREVGKSLFGSLISDRWIFDVELFYKIRKRNIRLHQMPIVWEHKDESKMKLFDPFIIGLQLIKLRVKLL